MKKSFIITIVVLIVSNLASYFIGSNSFYFGREVYNDDTESYPKLYWYNTSEALKLEREYCNAWMELAHYYLYDNNPSIVNSEYITDEDVERERNNYWLDVVSESKFYNRIDSLNQGDWEDWYTDWE